MTQIRKDIDLITESIKINEAWQELPVSVREDLNTIVSELNKLNEATLAPEQIQGVFQSLVTNRGEGGNTAQLAKKAQLQLTPLFAKITGNPKLKAILSKVGNAVPIDRLKVMVAKLPDPAGKNASAVVAAIQKGAQSIENDEDLAAFKGLMMTVITIGMGVAGAGGPAVLGIIGTTAIFRTVVDSALKAAAGGTVADIGKTAAVGAAKGAVAGIVGNAIGGIFDAEIQPPTVEDGIASVAPIEIDTTEIADAADIDVADASAAESLLTSYPETVEEFQLQAAQNWADSLAEQNYSELSPAMVQKMADNMTVTGDYPGNFTMATAGGGFNQGGIYLTPTEQAGWSQFAQGKSLGELVGDDGNAWLSQNVEGAEEFLADRAATAAAEAEALTVRYDAMSAEEQQAFDVDAAEAEELWSDEPYTPPGTPKYDAAAVGAAVKSEVGGDVSDNLTQSFVHPEWKNVLSEEVGEDFDALVEQVGEEVAVFVMFEWYNKYVKENQPIIEGMEHLQEHRLIENIEQVIMEAPVPGKAGALKGDQSAQGRKNYTDNYDAVFNKNKQAAPTPVSRPGMNTQDAPKPSLAQKIGGAYKKAVGKAGQAAKAVGSAAVNTVIKPILNSAPVKAFTNKIAAVTGMQGKIDPEKLQADYTAAKSPTESDDVAKFLQKNAGATKDEVDTAFKAAGIEAVAPEEEPEQEEQPQAGQEQPQAGGEQPQAGGEQPQADTNQDGKDDATGAPIAPQGASTPGEPETGAQGTTSGAAGGSTGGSGAIGKGVQQAQGGQAPTTDQEPAEPKIPNNKKAKVNGIEFTWSEEQNEWINAQGTPATGLMKQELMKQQGLDVTGNPPKKGLIGRAADYISGKTPGLAQATRSDPKAGILKKAGATAAAAVGGAIGGMFGGKGQPEQPAEPGTPEQPAQPAQPQGTEQPAQPQGTEQPAQQPAQQSVQPKAVPGPTTAELKMLQSKTLQGDLASAKALVAKLSELKSKGYDADKFIQAAAPVMKKGGLAKSDPQAYATFVKMARSMRAEAYEHMCAILEHAGLTWADIGYEVLISESVTSHVMLIPTDVVQMAEMKKLAGI